MQKTAVGKQRKLDHDKYPVSLQDPALLWISSLTRAHLKHFKTSRQTGPHLFLHSGLTRCGERSRERRHLTLAHWGCRRPRRQSVCLPVSLVCFGQQWSAYRKGSWMTYWSGCSPSSFPSPWQRNYVKPGKGVGQTDSPPWQPAAAA